MNIFQVQKHHKAKLLSNDTDTARRLAESWAARVKEIERELQTLMAEIIDARRRGEPIRASWILRQRRYQSLLTQIDYEIKRWCGNVSADVKRAQETALRAAVVDAKELIAIGRNGAPDAAGVFGSFNALSVDAMEAQAGFLADGSPLTDLFSEIHVAGLQSAKDALLSAIVAGLSPTQTAGKLRDALGVPLTRGLRIARTETLRSYREASIATYADDGIEQWQWVASHSMRTCPMCLAMSGRLFPVTTPFGSHPNCRCTPVSYFVDLADDFVTGEDWLHDQDSETQLEILGATLSDLFQRGDLKLAQLVGEHESAKWGTTRYTKSVGAVLKGL